jgi:hypothetical protein
MDVHPQGQYITGGAVYVEGTGSVGVGIYDWDNDNRNNSFPVGAETEFPVSGAQYYTFTFPNPIPVTPGGKYWLSFTAHGGTFTAYDNPYELNDCIIGWLKGYSVY